MSEQHYIYSNHITVESFCTTLKIVRMITLSYLLVANPIDTRPYNDLGWV